jgi:PIN domain nuclease of toxin-antitoxin system
LLLDANAFFWVQTQSPRVPPAVLADIRNPETDVAVGMGALWELLAKRSAGRLVIMGDLFRVAADSNIAVVPISAEHILSSTELPRHHADPFDRLLVAQARLDDRAILTGDRIIAAYPVETILL